MMFYDILLLFILFYSTVIIIIIIIIITVIITSKTNYNLIQHHTYLMLNTYTYFIQILNT